MKNRSRERAWFKNQSNERVRFKKRSTVMSKNSSWSQGATILDIWCTKGLDIWLISAWYPWFLAVGFDRNMAVFQRLFNFISLWRQSTDIGLCKPARIFDILLKSVRLIRSFFFLDIRLDFWYPVYRFPARRYLLVDRFFEWTLLLDRFLKLAFVPDRFLIPGIVVN